MHLAAIALCCSLSLALSAGECLVIDSEKVRAKHLAARFPVFAQLDPEVEVFRVSSPSLTAYIPPRQLVASLGQIGEGWNPPSSACVQWRVEELDLDAAVQAMRASIGSDDISIRVLERSLEKIPAGKLDFPLAGRRLQGSVFHWRGSVRYGPGWDYPVWVKVEILTSAPRVVARAGIRAGEKVSEMQVAVEERLTIPSDDYASSIDQVVGKIAKHNLSEGNEIRAKDLTHEPEVLRGELVNVEVRSGALRLLFAAKAQSSGVTGDLISIRNPYSNRDFKAVVDGKRRVLLEVGKK